MLRVNEEERPWTEDMTIEDLLEACEYSYHSLVVKVNGSLVKRRDWDEYRVPDGADVQVIHMMTGG